jgi:hypothetical protein
MNRHQRRALRVKGPKGEMLECRLLLIDERDVATGRPTSVRVCYDDETIEDVVQGRRTGVEFLLVWMAEGQGRKLD